MRREALGSFVMPIRTEPRGATDSARVEYSTTTGHDGRRRGIAFGPAARRGHTGGQSPHPPPPPLFRGSGGGGATRCVTPRQACPRPEGFGRNLRSKTRWFTGFCNSHQVSHFATFFIDARAEISVAESRFDIEEALRRPPPGRTPRTGREGGGTGASLQFALALSAPGFVSPSGARAGSAPPGVGGTAMGGLTRPRRGPPVFGNVFAVCSFRYRQ